MITLGLIILFLIFLITIPILCILELENKPYYRPTGNYEENRIYRILEAIKDPEEKILQNLYIPKENKLNTETTEIDLLYISKTGLYCIEVKDYSGWIFGNKDQTYWTVTYKSGKHIKMYNPIKQNENHIKYLSRIIYDVPIKNIVVLSDESELKNITLDENITHEHQFRNLINWHRAHKEIINAEKIEMIYQALLLLTRPTEKTRQKHIENIRKRKNS